MRSRLIRVMSAAEHTGKLVLDVPAVRAAPAVVVPPEQVRAFRRDGSYIVTGGLGGIGLFLAEKMAAAGCGRIVLSSRSAPSPKALETIELIRAMGTDIEVECGDIADVGTATRLVNVATATGLPLRGVLHAAAVFENAMLATMTDELIDRNWVPKVNGAWNLHQATATLPWTGSACSRRRWAWWGRRDRGVRRGQQLAGRIRAVAPDPGPSRHGDRVGAVGGGRSRRRNPGRDRGGVGARTGRRRHRNRALA